MKGDVDNIIVDCQLPSLLPLAVHPHVHLTCLTFALCLLIRCLQPVLQAMAGADVHI
jgi:hypothetical protein